LTAELTVLPDAESLAAAAADLLAAEAASAIAGRGRFVVALAGGTTFTAAYRLLAASPRRESVDWSRVEVFFGDERSVPEGAPERNDRAAREALLAHVPIPAENVHTLDETKRDPAGRYEAEILETFGAPTGTVPRFDLVLLGMGPDGHVASLFPGHDALKAVERLVIRVAGSPKPPPERFTVTLPVLNAARTVLLVASGSAKSEAFARLRAGDPAVPAARVTLPDGRLVSIVDQECAVRRYSRETAGGRTSGSLCSTESTAASRSESSRSTGAATSRGSRRRCAGS
jgi:6-phosphogluconolactonase